MICGRALNVVESYLGHAFRRFFSLALVCSVSISPAFDRRNAIDNCFGFYRHKMHYKLFASNFYNFAPYISLCC